MNQLEYISAVSSSVHESVENWARNLLREGGIETTEIYGQFPPEGSVASHIVLFPYRISQGDEQVSTAYKEISMLGTQAEKALTGSLPPSYMLIAKAITRMISEKFPKLQSGPYRGRPHPAPPVDKLPSPMREWYQEQMDSGAESSWITRFNEHAFARLPSLAWVNGITLRIQYLVVVGEGARGTAERAAPISIQGLSVLTAGAQMKRQLVIRAPPLPYNPLLSSYTAAIAGCLDDEDEMKQEILEMLPTLDKKVNLPVNLMPGAKLTNADFTGLMQALQRPLQPTLHLALQMQLGGGPIFAPGISAEINANDVLGR